MGISFGSINTGLPKDIVKQIVEAEKIPMKKMEVRKGKFEDKKKLVDELTKLMEDLRGELRKNGDARGLKEFKANDNEAFGVTIDKGAAFSGNYQIEVLELARKSSAMSSGFADKDDSYIGVGYFKYYLPNGEVQETYVDVEHSSLTGLAKLINEDPDNGMRANVVNDGSGSNTPWRLVVALDDTGDDKRADFPYFYFVDGEKDFFLEFEREAHDAKLKLDGFEIEVPQNKVKDLIPGVTLDLKKAVPGQEFTLSVAEDTEAITEKIEAFVDKINAVLKFIKKQNTLDEKSDTSRTLGGDILLQTLESRIRSVVFKDVSTDDGNRRIGDIGVTFQRDGLLKLDSNKFTNAIKQNYQTVAQILTGKYTAEGGKTPGFFDHLRDVAELSLRAPSGLLPSRKNGLQTNIDQIDRRISDRQRIIEQKEKNLKNKFARLEGTISKLKSSGAGISALGASAPSPVQQLG